MPSTTAATDPLSHYEVLSALWAAACTARGTDLRGQSLVNLDVLNSMPDGFVVELGSKLRPAGIEYGLGQAGSGESSRIDVADTDAPVLKMSPSRILDPVAACQHHGDRVVAMREVDNQDAEFSGQFHVRSPRL